MLWAKENQEIMKAIYDTYTKYFKIRSIVPQITEDWEMGKEVWIKVLVADLISEDNVDNFLAKVESASKEVHGRFPKKRFIVEVLPVTNCEE